MIMESPSPQTELESLPVIRFRRSWRSIIPWILAVIVLGWAVLWATAEWPRSVLVFPISNQTSVPLPMFFALWLVVAIRPVMLMLDAHYEISHHHLRAVTGILSLHRRSVEITYEDLLTVEVEQNILERILFVGHVIAGSAMSDAPRIVMEGVGCPDYYASLIDHRVDLTRKMMLSRLIPPALSASA